MKTENKLPDNSAEAKKGKTVEQWFNELPEGYKELALKIMINPNVLCEYMSGAIFVGIISRPRLSTGKWIFWNKVRSHYGWLENSPQLPPLPK